MAATDPVSDAINEKTAEFDYCMRKIYHTVTLSIKLCLFLALAISGHTHQGDGFGSIFISCIVSGVLNLEEFRFVTKYTASLTLGLVIYSGPKIFCEIILDYFPILKS